MRSIHQASQTILKVRRVKVQIYALTYALTHLCTRCIYCLEGRRLTDQLNDVFPGTTPEEKLFLPGKEVEMSSIRGYLLLLNSCRF